MTKFLITSDWRLQGGDPGLEQKPIDELLTFAIRYQPDLIIHAGNVWASLEPDLSLGFAALECLSRRAPTIVIRGHKPFLCYPGSISLSTANRLWKFEWGQVLHLHTETSESSFVEWLLKPHRFHMDEINILLSHGQPLSAEIGINHDIPNWYVDETWENGFDLTIFGGICKPQLLTDLVLVPGSPTITRQRDIMEYYNDEPEPQEDRGFWTWEPGNAPEFHPTHPIRTPDPKKAIRELFDL